MALEFAHGAIRWLAADAVNTTYQVSGLAFQPKALRFYWCGLDSAGTDVASEAVNLRRGIGFAVGTSSRRSVGSFSQDTAGTSNCGTVASNDCVACTTDGAGARDGLLDISAIASDGFTLIVDDQGVADITIFWEAWGGSDITVAAVGDIAEPAASGNQDYTVTGFVSGATDQVVMLAGVQSVAAVNTAEAEASGMFIGFAASATAADNICVSGNSDDASTAMDTDGHCISDECLGMIAKAGAATVGTRAVLTQFGTDNFRLNWAAVSVTNRRSIFLAIKGGRWQSGSITIAGNTLNNTSAVSNTIFTPIGMCLIGRMTAEQATNVSTANDRIGIGTGTSTTSRRSMGMLDEDATASSACEINTTIQYDQVLCYPSTAGALLTAYDISSMDTAGFTLINDLAGGVASEWIGYLTFGNPVANTGSESLPTGLTESASTAVVLTTSDSLAIQLTESAAITLVALNTSDSVTVSVSETDITAFEYNLIESLPLNLTESASVDTGGAVPIAGSESLQIGFTEDASIKSIVAASDDLSIGLTETATQLVAQASSDSLTLGLTESATELVHQFVSESLSIGLTEQATEQISASASDSLQIGLTDNAATAVTLASSDDVAIGLTESASPIANIIGSDSLAVIVSEADITAFELNLIESLPLGLTDTATIDTGSGLSTVSTSDSLTIGLTDNAVIASTLSVSDSLSLALSESATAVASLPASDSLSIGITEAATIAASVLADDTIVIGLNEAASVDNGTLVQKTASDSVSIVTSEVDIARFEYNLIESLSIGLTDTSTLVTPNPSESLTIGLTESATMNRYLTASDSLTIVAHEPDTISQQVATSDSMRDGIQEAATVVDLTGGFSSITASDSLTIGLTEAATVAARINAADTLATQLAEQYAFEQVVLAGDSITIGLSEAATVVDLSGNFVAQTASDSLPISITDSAVVLKSEVVSDSLPIGLLEQSTVEIGGQVVKVGSDQLALNLGEDATVNVAQTVQDSLSAGISEDTIILNRLDASSDALKIGLTETANIVDLTGGLSNKNSDDSLRIGLTEETSLYSTGVTNDTGSLGLQESSTVIIVVATSDSITVGLQDESQTISVTLQASDDLPLGYAEDVLQHVLVAAEDSLSAVLDEATFTFNEFVATDSLAVVVVESSLVEIAGGLVLRSTSDDLRTSITDTGLVVTRTVGSICPIVATVERLGVRHQTARATGIPNTATADGLPHDAEVIAMA